MRPAAIENNRHTCLLLFLTTIRTRSPSHLNAAHFDEPLEELKELADYAKENGLTAIFMETLENPEVANVLAEEAGLTSLVLNPIEGLTEAEQINNETYFSIMRSNLANLKTGLQCP